MHNGSFVNTNFVLVFVTDYRNICLSLSDDATNELPEPEAVPNVSAKILFSPSPLEFIYF